MDEHPLAALFPRMSEGRFKELRADLRANGMREAIVLYEGKILDGRHRYLASEAEGVQPRYRDLSAGEDPLAFVVSLNMVRRDLDASQRAAIAVEIEGAFTERAKARQSAAGKSSAPGRKAEKVTPDLGEVSKRHDGQALRQAAKSVGAGGASAEKAKAVKRHDPDLFEKVKAGEVKVDAAAKAVSEQAAYAKAVDEFPFLAAEESPGVPIPEVVKIAEGLRRYPEGPERETRIESAKRWHRRYAPDVQADRIAAERNRLAFEGAERIIEAAANLAVVAERNGGVATLEAVIQDLSQFHAENWFDTVVAAHEITCGLVAAISQPKIRRVK